VWVSNGVSSLARSLAHREREGAPRPSLAHHVHAHRRAPLPCALRSCWVQAGRLDGRAPPCHICHAFIDSDIDSDIDIDININMILILILTLTLTSTSTSTTTLRYTLQGEQPGYNQAYRSLTRRGLLDSALRGPQPPGAFAQARAEEQEAGVDVLRRPCSERFM
jgi:hypothetical protein